MSVQQPLDLYRLVHRVQVIAQQAAEIILPYFTNTVAYEDKADGSPVTQADMLADAWIRQALQQLTPQIPILTEETADQISSVERLTWQRLWLVDPLDGTRQFIRGDAGFSVNIALVDQHKPILGVVYAPVTQVGYAAVVGGGAWRWDADGTRSIHVAPIAQPMRVLTGFSPVRRGTMTTQFLDALPAYQLTELGSSLKICQIAEGLADVYPRFGLTSEWDTAAAQVILSEAGGALLGLTRHPLIYNTRHTLENVPFVAVGQSMYPWPMLTSVEVG